MSTTIDPVTLVNNLDPDLLREQLRELERQQRAVRVLLRAAIAREKKLAKTAVSSAAPAPAKKEDAPR